MKLFTLTNKQSLQSYLTTNSKHAYYLTYDTSTGATSALETNAVAAGYTQYYREVNGTIVEVIYTK